MLFPENINRFNHSARTLQTDRETDRITMLILRHNNNNNNNPICKAPECQKTSVAGAGLYSSRGKNTSCCQTRRTRQCCLSARQCTGIHMQSNCCSAQFLTRFFWAMPPTHLNPMDYNTYWFMHQCEYELCMSQQDWRNRAATGWSLTKP